MGPLISSEHREKVAAYVPDNAPVAIRGDAPEGPGFWFPPTVLAPLDNKDTAAEEEIFGPVVAVIPFEDEEFAVRLANDTVYGLSWFGLDAKRGQGHARRPPHRGRRPLHQLQHLRQGRYNLSAG